MLSNISLVLLIFLPFLPCYSIFINSKSIKCFIPFLMCLISGALFFFLPYRLIFNVFGYNYDFSIPATMSITYVACIGVSCLLFKKRFPLKSLFLILLPFFVDATYKFAFIHFSQQGWDAYNIGIIENEYLDVYAFGYLYYSIATLFLFQLIFFKRKVLPTKIYIGSCLILFFLVALAFFIERFLWMLMTPENSELLHTVSRLVILCLHLLMIIYLMVFYESILAVRKHRNIQEKQKESLNDYYTEYINITLDEMLKIKHDVNNFVQVLEIDNKKIANQIKDKLKVYDVVYICQDDLINKILIVKVNQAKQSGIEFNVECSGVENVKMNESDKISLFSNIIDNAINAATVSKEKKIDLRIIYKDDFLSISQVNSCDDDRVATKDKLYHGKGRRIIKSIVDWYGGNIFTNYLNKKYILQIELDLRNERLHI